MMITLCSASPVWATEAAPAAAAAENLAETGNGKTEEIKPAETNLSEAKPEDANPPGEKPGETAPPAEKPTPEKEKEKSPSGSGESEGSGKLTVDGYEVYAALSGNSPMRCPPRWWNRQKSAPWAFLIVCAQCTAAVSARQRHSRRPGPGRCPASHTVFNLSNCLF